MTWPVEASRGSAAALHGRDALAHARRRVDVLSVDKQSLVLGSAQRSEIVDGSAAHDRGIEVVRRRTGGGAVYLEPDDHVWIDVTIPIDDPLWHDDVARAFAWLGGVWRRALAEVGVAALTVNDTAVCHSVLGRLICFAGLGFGELSTDDGKVVGLAQRRTRDGAWFQCTVLRHWDPEPYARVLAPGLRAAAEDPVAELAAVRVHPIEVAPEALVDAFVRNLPAGRAGGD